MKIVQEVYPACAGIDRVIVISAASAYSLPRMRGDRPSGRRWIWSLYSFTPHARGSTAVIVKIEAEIHVYPACAGIDLYKLLG